MYKKTQAHQDYIKRTGRYSDRIHPARGLIENVLQSELPISEKRQALIELRQAIDMERNEVDARLRKAKDALGLMGGLAHATGKYADPNHFRIVKGDVHKLTVLSQHLMRMLGFIKDWIREHDTNSLSELFMDAARRQLPENTFDLLMREALRQAEQRQGSTRQKPLPPGEVADLPDR